MSEKSLYERLGGYDAIAAVVAALMVRIKDDDKLRRFYDHRGSPCESSGSPSASSLRPRTVRRLCAC